MPCSSVSLRNEPRIVARNEASTIETGSAAAGGGGVGAGGGGGEGAAGRRGEAGQRGGGGGLAGAALADHGDDRGRLGIDRQRQPGESEGALAAEPAREALADVDRLDQRGH